MAPGLNQAVPKQFNSAEGMTIAGFSARSLREKTMQDNSSSSYGGIIKYAESLPGGMRGIAVIPHAYAWLADLGARIYWRIGTALTRRQGAVIMYVGRTSEFLVMTSECVEIPCEGLTLEQLLQRLRRRGGRWACELAGDHVICSVDGEAAKLSDNLRNGCEVCIASRKSIFEE